MAYRQMWQIEVRHDGLNKYRLIRGSDQYVVEQKAAAQHAAWSELWAKRLEAEERKQAIRSKEEKKALASNRTEDARSALTALEGTLAHTLQVDDEIQWESLLDKTPYPHARPPRHNSDPLPAEPSSSDPKYKPVLGIFDKLFAKRRELKLQEAEALFSADHNAWKTRKSAVEEKNSQNERKYVSAIALWEKTKAEYEARQSATNKRICEQKDRYFEKEVGAITDYCEMVLRNSEYPDYFPQEWDIEYRSESRSLLVDYDLPNIETIPATKAVKYIPSTDDFVEVKLSDAELNRLYDSLLYQIALRTIHELYEADRVDALRAVFFNGYVTCVDKSTGLTINPCIMSVQASKDEFLAFDLSNIDPKACFKRLKGVGSAKLHGLAPVAPIAKINKEDRRFVTPQDVIASIGAADNLATMDWKDFENLIREIFEKEFASNGGEVKITQASRDGGVDAVAFDPDPIRGGKIVIQAKRYTNTVGVSAVRDLYGTTLNEGATKGILVTTAEYGPDAYRFAQGKPLTLLNGGNLLHLLAKHGHRAKIDLREARQDRKALKP
jgi:restriction system protein